MKFCLVDANNMIHRARHVQQTNDIDVVVGMSLHTTFMSLNRVFHKFGSDHVVACFDTSSWRKVFYEQYKANRKENLTSVDKKVNESIYEVCNELSKFLDEQTNVTMLKHDLVEADDFIAHWIKKHPNDEHIIISSDADFKQLIAPNVNIYNGVTGELTTIDGIFFQDGQKDKKYPRKVYYGETWKQKLVKTKTEITDDPVVVEPDWELFLKIMKGDKSDNIPAAHIPRYRTKKIREAFENPGGAAWTNMMDGIYDREVIEEDGLKHVKDITVHDMYERNQLLVDLSRQPDEIIELMDQVIDDKINKPFKKQVGVRFLQYCGRYQLLKLAENATSYGKTLSARYKHD